jgi:hypothetical protein
MPAATDDKGMQRFLACLVRHRIVTYLARYLSGSSPVQLPDRIKRRDDQLAELGLLLRFRVNPLWHHALPMHPSAICSVNQVLKYGVVFIRPEAQCNKTAFKRCSRPAPGNLLCWCGISLSAVYEVVIVDPAPNIRRQQHLQLYHGNALCGQECCILM